MPSILMITITTENYNLISQDFYDNIINSLDLNLIPCTCGHSGCLIRHGSYKRNIKLTDEVLSLTVVRVYCNSCGHTHALLLSSIVPYSQIPLAVQADAIKAFEDGISPCRVLDGQCMIDENNIRSIIRSYKCHWMERLRSISLSTFEYPPLIAGCFLHFKRQFMQIKRTRNKLFLLPT